MHGDVGRLLGLAGIGAAPVAPADGAEPGTRRTTGTPSPFGVAAATSGTSLLTSKDMLVAFSHAMEQECDSNLDGAHVFGSFQHARFYAPARPTWSRLATAARSAHVFADFEQSRPASTDGPCEVVIAPGSPLHREWTIVVDRPQGAMALTARERPDGGSGPDGARLYDSAWTTDPLVVRRLAQLLAAAVVEAGCPSGPELAAELALPPLRVTPDEGLRERLLDRLLDLIDT